MNYDFHSVFRLDAETGRLFWKAPPKNHAQRIGMEAGSACIGLGKNKTYWHIQAFGCVFKRSRVVFFMVNGRWPMPAVDHIDGDSLNDRPCNLRECTYSQNAANSKWQKPSGLPRGVYLTRQGKFICRITKDRRTVNLGTYDDLAAASLIVIAARKEVFHGFA